MYLAWVPVPSTRHRIHCVLRVWVPSSGAALPLGCTNVALQMYSRVELSSFLRDQRQRKILKRVERARRGCVCKKMWAGAVTWNVIIMAIRAHTPQLQISLTLCLALRKTYRYSALYWKVWYRDCNGKSIALLLGVRMPCVASCSGEVGAGTGTGTGTVRTMLIVWTVWCVLYS